MTDGEAMEKKCDCLVIGYDMSGDDITCLTVARKHGSGWDIINALYGKEAEKIYETLTIGGKEGSQNTTEDSR